MRARTSTRYCGSCRPTIVRSTATRTGRREELREEWARARPRCDAWVAVDGDLIVGVMHLAASDGGRINADGYVHPDHRGRGVGGSMLAAAEARAREIEPGLVPGQRVYLETAHLVGDPGAPALLDGKGIRACANVLPDGPIARTSEPGPAVPPGIELRPFDPDADGRVVHAAVEEAFANEWGHRQRPYLDWHEAVTGSAAVRRRADSGCVGRRRSRRRFAQLRQAHGRLGFHTATSRCGRRGAAEGSGSRSCTRAFDALRLAERRPPHSGSTVRIPRARPVSTSGLGCVCCGAPMSADAGRCCRRGR